MFCFNVEDNMEPKLLYLEKRLSLDSAQRSERSWLANLQSIRLTLRKGIGNSFEKGLEL